MWAREAQHSSPSLASCVASSPSLPKVRASWAGNYDYNTWDQNGIVGRHPALPNTFLACGFSGHGIQQGPAVGRALAELILDGGYRWVLQAAGTSPSQVT